MASLPSQTAAGRILRVNIAARRLNKSVRTVRWYAETGQLHGFKTGVKLWAFYESDVEAFKRHLQDEPRGEAA